MNRKGVWRRNGRCDEGRGEKGEGVMRNECIKKRGVDEEKKEKKVDEWKKNKREWWKRLLTDRTWAHFLCECLSGFESIPNASHLHTQTHPCVYLSACLCLCGGGGAQKSEEGEE